MADIDKVRVKMVAVPFNYHWPYGGNVSVVRELGPALLDRSIAEAAVKAGAAIPFDPAPTAKKAPARRRSTAATKPANTADDAADSGATMDDAG